MKVLDASRIRGGADAGGANCRRWCCSRALTCAAAVPPKSFSTGPPSASEDRSTSGRGASTSGAAGSATPQPERSTRHLPSQPGSFIREWKKRPALARSGEPSKAGDAGSEPEHAVVHAHAPQPQGMSLQQQYTGSPPRKSGIPRQKHAGPSKHAGSSKHVDVLGLRQEKKLTVALVNCVSVEQLLSCLRKHEAAANGIAMAAAITHLAKLLEGRGSKSRQTQGSRGEALQRQGQGHPRVAGQVQHQHRASPLPLGMRQPDAQMAQAAEALALSMSLLRPHFRQLGSRGFANAAWACSKMATAEGSTAGSAAPPEPHTSTTASAAAAGVAAADLPALAAACASELADEFVTRGCTTRANAQARRAGGVPCANQLPCISIATSLVWELGGNGATCGNSSAESVLCKHSSIFFRCAYTMLACCV